jgi:diguanylate cyclase (GGDEF)-like protein/PAS domain S-box-containing protein
MPASDRKVPVAHSDGKLDRQEIEKQGTDLFAKFAERIDAGISATDEEGRIIFWNHTLAALTGISAERTMGEFIWDVYFNLLTEVSRTSQNLAHLKESFLALLQTGRSDFQDHLSEYEYTRPDGQQVMLRGTIYVIPTAHGYSLFSLSEDISEQKHAAQVLKASEEKFRNIVEQANDAIIIFDQDETVLEWNLGCERISGLKREEVIGKHLSEVVPDIFRAQEWGDERNSFSIHDRVLKNLEEIIETGAPRFVEGHILSHADGDRRWVQSVTFPIQAGPLKLFGSIARDLTTVKQTENRLQRYTRQLETLRQAGLEIAAELGLDSLVWMIAPRAIEMLNGTAMALYLYNAEKDILELAISLGENQPEIEKTAQRGKTLAGHVWETGKAILLEDYHTGRTANLEKKYWGKVVGAPIIWGMDFLGVLFVFSDQPFYETDLKILELFTAHAAAAIRNARLHQQLSRFAITDSLTGIFNRRHFFELAEAEFQEALRYDRPFSVLMFDLDLFKQVNDTHGHSRGDEILRTVVQRCAATVRQADILGRYGGEEFVIALPQTGSKKALALADRLRQIISATPITTEKGLLTVTVSFGVSTLSPDIKNLMQLLNRADTALYESKRSGRNRVCVWSESLNNTLTKD